jgi:hypothetical protein
MKKSFPLLLLLLPLLLLLNSSCAQVEFERTYNTPSTNDVPKKGGILPALK